MKSAFDDMRFMVCLYGIALDKAEIVPLMGEIDEFLGATGQHPTHLSVRARGFGKKPLLFKRAFKRLQKTAPAELVSVGLYSLVDDWITLGDWTAIGSVFVEDSYFGLGTSLGTVPDVEQRVVCFVRRWIERMQPAYGIGFYHPLARGPNAYGIGLSYGYSDAFFGPDGEASRAESRAVNRWSDGMDEAVYDRGILRDVYPYSLLTRRHLERNVVDGSRLGDWIQAEPWRGQLSACDNGYTLWTVALEHLASVRRQLATAGALYVLPRENHL